MEATLGRIGRSESIGAVHHDERKGNTEPPRHLVGVGPVDGDDPVGAARPASLGPGQQPACGAPQAGQVGGLEVDVAGVVDDSSSVASGQVEGDRDPHVGHPVIQICRWCDAASEAALGSDGERDGEPANGPDRGPNGERGGRRGRRVRRRLRGVRLGDHRGSRLEPRFDGRGVADLVPPAEPADHLPAAACEARKGQAVDRGRVDVEDPVAGRVQLLGCEAGPPSGEDGHRVAPRSEGAGDAVGPRVELRRRRQHQHRTLPDDRGVGVQRPRLGRLGHRGDRPEPDASSAVTMASAAPAGARANELARSRARCSARSSGARRSSSTSARARSRPTTTIRPPDVHRLDPLGRAAQHEARASRARPPRAGRRPSRSGRRPHGAGAPATSDSPAARRRGRPGRQPDSGGLERRPRARVERRGSTGRSGRAAASRMPVQAASASGSRFSARWIVAKR